MLHQNSHPSPTEIGLDTSLFSSVESTSSDSPDVSCPETVISENSVDCHWNDRAVCGRIVARLGSQSKQLLHRVTRYPVVVLGSRSDCDWPLPGSGLAELQACFLFIDKRIYCVDLTGTYALKVRGGRFQQIWVHDGSVVEIGNLRLRLYTGENTHESGAISSGTESRRPLNDRIDPIADEAQLETDAEEFACSRFLELTKNGSISPRRYEMTRNITLIGRDSPSTIRLKDPSLSVVSSALVQTRNGVWHVNIQSSGNSDKVPSDGSGRSNHDDNRPNRCHVWQAGQSIQMGRFHIQLFEDTNGNGKRSEESPELNMAQRH
ncbi:MAG: FHA domain-containing protein [Planctomycetota bacterium]|nr:FHA domain-containing protein [Planctomycetota bacterium]MDA1211715.1 FHA domain-containing protein [Planctomycetota bacterium]